MRAKFKIIVSTVTNPGTEIPFHFNSLTNAVPCARLYKVTPLVFSINIYDEFDLLWVWTPELGEKEMSRFVQNAAARSNRTYVGAELKKVIATVRIPFTIHKVSGPTERTFTVGRRETKSMLYDLLISFKNGSKEQTYEQLYKEYGIPEEAVLSFASGYESRDQAIEDIRADLADDEVVRAVVTYDPDFGPQGWYDLRPAE